jgi:hypothetical protein
MNEKPRELTSAVTDASGLPDFVRLPIAKNLLFSPSKDTGCVLPCWQALRPNVSNRADVQDMFDEVFEFDGQIDFFGSKTYYPLFRRVDLSVNTTGYGWGYGEDGTAGFNIIVVTEKDTGLLKGIKFDIVPDDVIKVNTADEVLRELGRPSAAYATLDIHLTNDPPLAVLDLEMLYKQGIHTSYHYFLFTTDDTQGEFELFCLNRVPIVATYHLIEAFAVQEPSDVALREYWVLEGLKKSRPELIQNALNISIEELTQLADEQVPCININQR